MKMTFHDFGKYLFPGLYEEATTTYNSIPHFIKAIQGKSLHKSDINNTLNKALDKAYKIRQFEIGLYWQRATYFWGFMIVIFTAYFIVIEPSKMISPTYQFLTSCLGLIFSLGGYLVNRGSGYWLTHWERIIDAIETYQKTTLYKVNLQEHKPWKLDGNYPHSVSRINLLVSLSTCFVWVSLVGNTFYHYHNNWKICLLLLATLFVVYWLLFQTKSGKGEGDTYSFYKRGVEYENEN